MVKVSYTLEEKRRVVRLFKRIGSATKTIRRLGYPSLHVLYDWAKNGARPRKTRQPLRPAKKYSWRLKLTAVQRVETGEDVRKVARDLGITTPVTLFSWRSRYRSGGTLSLMTRREKKQLTRFTTIHQMKASLPNDKEELKDLAVRLMAEKAVLQERLWLSKKLPTHHREDAAQDQEQDRRQS